jgi:hypothetical protein
MQDRYFRKTAAIVGALFIIATASSIASIPFLGTDFDEPDYVLGLSNIENDVVIAAILMTVLAISLIGIGALMFPVLREQTEGLGMAYTGFRLVEAIFIIFSAVCLLGMLSVGQDYSNGLLDESTALSLGELLGTLRDWSFLFGTLIFLGLGCLTLNYLLYRSVLVPRWLSAFGLIGGFGILIYGTMGLFGTETSSFDATSFLAAPIAVQEMVFASWLIIKGFYAPANASEEGRARR